MKSMIFVFVPVLLIVGCSDDTILREKAEQIAQNTIIVDTHIDAPYRVMSRREDISIETKGNFDYPKAITGGLNVPFMAIYVPAERKASESAKSLADSLINLVEGFVRQWPDKFQLARSVSDVTRQFGSGKISLAMGMENGDPIEGEIQNLRYFYDRGIRYITLAHSKSNHICDSSYDQNHQWNGLSPFGREVIPEMNRLGLMIDVSHVTDSTFYQVLRLSRAPVIASHSACRKFTPGWERNISDEMLVALAQNGGVIQVNFGSSFVNDAYRKNFEPMWDHLEENKMKFGNPAKIEYIKKYKKEHPMDYADITEVVDHIDHAVKIAGIEHVGLGSDFDGLGDTLPKGLKNVSDFPNLIYHLLKRGYSEEDIEKICSGNILRVWSEVEQVAGNK